MDNAILITSKIISLNQLMGYCNNLIPFKVVENSLNYTMPNGFWVAIYPCSSCIDDYETKALDRIKEIIEDPQFFIIEGNRFDMIQKIVNSLPIEINLLVDNTHGKIMDRNDFLEYKGSEDFFSW